MLHGNTERLAMLLRKRVAGDGAFLNAARLTASSFLFAATPLCCWALPRPAAPAFLAHRPTLPGFRYRLLPIGAWPAPVTSLTGSISVVRCASAPNRSSEADTQLKSTISPATLFLCTSGLSAFAESDAVTVRDRSRCRPRGCSGGCSRRPEVRL